MHFKFVGIRSRLRFTRWWPNTSLERTREGQSAKFIRRRARRSTQSLGHAIEGTEVLHQEGGLVSSACSFARPSQTAVGIPLHCLFTVQSRPYDRPAVHSAASVPAKLGRVASIPEIGGVRVASSLAATRYVAVASASTASVAIVASLRSSSLPNNRLVATTQPHARLGSRGTHAAVAPQP